MAKVVYGVSGEGSGHSSRAREMATHLLERGHDVKLASYDRGYRNLCADFDVLEIEGLSIASSDNKVSVVGTFVENLRRPDDVVPPRADEYRQSKLGSETAGAVPSGPSD